VYYSNKAVKNFCNENPIKEFITTSLKLGHASTKLAYFSIKQDNSLIKQINIIANLGSIIILINNITGIYQQLNFLSSKIARNCFFP